MSTTSSYSSNKLLQVTGNETQHFISKSYITPIFESNRSVSEYHLYWYNSNKPSTSKEDIYHRMSYKKMNKKEIRMFFDIEDYYLISIENKHGCVWEHKDLGFDKSKVIISQFNIPYL